MQEVRLTEQLNSLHKQREDFKVKVAAKGYDYSKLEDERSARAARRDQIKEYVAAVLEGKNVAPPFDTTAAAADAPAPAPTQSVNEPSAPPVPDPVPPEQFLQPDPVDNWVPSASDKPTNPFPW